MKMSVITPTHNPSHIIELYNSLNVQEHKDWEWILYVNNGGIKAIKDKKFDPIRNDPRVRIIKSKSGSTKVGAQKALAFKEGTGDVLVEVDHDDVLDGRCLSILADVFIKEPNVGFAYSSDWRFNDDGTDPGNFGEFWGWRERAKINWRRRVCVANKAFPPSANAFSKIFYAPDHVRAWRKDVYYKVGGHNKNYSVLDDLELMMKTYLETKIGFIEAPLYYYRVTGENTWIQRQQEIFDLGVKLSREYLLPLADRDADLRNLKKLYLGDPKYMPKGYNRIDIGLYNTNTAGIIYVRNSKKVQEELNLEQAFHLLADFGWVIFEGGEINPEEIMAAIPNDMQFSKYRFQVFHKQYGKDPFVALSAVKDPKIRRPHHHKYSIPQENNRAA